MRYATLILAVLFAQLTSAAATEVLLKARDQTTPNWAEALSKQFKGTIAKQVPGLNATILQIPASDVENLLKEARDNPAISAVETGGDYRQLFQITPTADFSSIQMSQTQKDDVSRLRERKTSASVYVARLRPAGMSFELLRGALAIADGFSTEKGMKLNLAPGVTVDALQTGIKQRGPSSFVWYGKIENREASGNEGGSATFVVQDETITGMVATGSDVYIVNPLGNGLHAIVKSNSGGFPPDHPPGVQPLRRDTPELRLQKKGAVENQAAPEIQALVLFTPAVRTALGPRNSPDFWATLAVEAANLVSKNSHARVSLKLVKSKEIDYVEKDFLADRDMLVGSEWVKTEREAAKADVVFLLTVHDEGCGASAQILADRDTAFSVVDYMCAVGNFSLAHEFGHLLGLRHHRAADKCDKPFMNGHGYVYENEWGTIEAQRLLCDGCPPPPPRKAYWSNPSIKYNGVPMGTEDHENSVEVINETASFLAGFH